MRESLTTGGSKQAGNFGLSQMLLSALRHVGHDIRAPHALIERAAASQEPDARGLAYLALAIEALQAGKLLQSRDLAATASTELELAPESSEFFWATWTSLRIDGLASFLLGDRERGSEAMQNGLSVAWASADGNLIGNSFLDLAEQSMRRSNFGESFKLFSDAIEHTAHGPVQVVAIHSLGDLFHANNEPDLGDGYHQQARKFLHLLSSSAESRLRYRYASTLTHAGKLRQAREEMDRSLSLIARHSDFTQAPAWTENAELLAVEGKPTEAEVQARKGLAASQLCGDQIHGALAVQALVPLLLTSDRCEEALQHLATVDTEFLLSSELERFLRSRLAAQRRLERWREASNTHRELAQLIDERQYDLASFHDDSLPQREPGRPPLQLNGLDDKVHELEELRRDRDEVIRVMTTDIWPPLKELSGTVSALSDCLGSTPLETCKLDEAKSTIQKIKTLSAQLATSGELDAGRISAIIQPVPLTDALNEVAGQAQVMSHSRGVRIIIDGTDDLVVLADRGLLEQVMTNLLAAALRLSPPSSTVRTSTQVAADRSATLQVHAEGTPLDPADRKLLFSKHARIQTSSGIAIGLGLYVARQLMHAMSGSLVLLPQRPGAGTSFEATFTPPSDHAGRSDNARLDAPARPAS